MTYVCTYPACLARGTGLKCNKQCPVLPEKRKPGSAGNTLKKTAIRKQTPKAKQKAVDKGMLVETDAAFYFDIWQSRNHVCFECGKPITEAFSSKLTHHVLGKRESVHNYSDYSQYRHCKWNIVLLHWAIGCHGTADADNAPKVKTYKDQLISLHEAGKLQNVSPDKDFIDAGI